MMIGAFCLVVADGCFAYVDLCSLVFLSLRNINSAAGSSTKADIAPYIFMTAGGAPHPRFGIVVQ